MSSPGDKLRIKEDSRVGAVGSQKRRNEEKRKRWRFCLDFQFRIPYNTNLMDTDFEKNAILCGMRFSPGQALLSKPAKYIFIIKS